MDLDDLKQRWEDQDRKLDASLRWNTRLLHASTLGRAETTMKRLSAMLWLELLLSFGLILWLGHFIAEHAAEARFLLPAAALDLGAIVFAIAVIHQLVAIGNLDYGEPVVAIQKRLESLRAQRIRLTQQVLLWSPLAWTPLLIVALKGLLGLNAYAMFSGAWLAVNVLFGLAVIPLAIWISRRYADRMGRSPWVQRLMRDIAGYNLNAAAGFLSLLAEFEKEEQRA